MRRSLLTLKLERINYGDLLAMGNAVKKGLTDAAIIYDHPNPSLLSYGAILSDYKEKLTAWSDKSTRSRLDLIKLHEVQERLKVALKQLSQFCENKTPGDIESLQKTGFPIRKQAVPTGKLSAVRNLRQIFKSKQIVRGMLKIQWDKPANAATAIMRGYLIFRSATNSFADAKQVGLTGKNYFIDENPPSGGNYYWCIPVGSAGEGIISNSCFAVGC